jgi:hypothetical protein
MKWLVPIVLIFFGELWLALLVTIVFLAFE